LDSALYIFALQLQKMKFSV